MYISEWGPFKKHFHKNSEGYDKMHEACVFFVKFLRDYCLKNNYEFHIIGRPLDEKDCKKEVEFYDNCIGSKKWNYIKTKKSRSSSYDELDKHEIIASITSTMGYESLSRKTKQLYSTEDIAILSAFQKLANDGPFWTSCYDKKNLQK